MSYPLRPYALYLIAAILLTGVWFGDAVAAPKRGQSSVAVAHFAPFGETVADTAVTMRLDRRTRQVRYGERFTLPSLANGQHEFTVDTSEGSFTWRFPTDAPGHYTLILTGGKWGVPFALREFRLGDAPPPPGSANVRVANIAPYAEAGDSEVELCRPDGTLFHKITNLGYGRQTGYLAIPAGDYEVFIYRDVKPDGRPIDYKTCTVQYGGPFPVQVADGEIVDFFVVGRKTADFPYDLVTTRNLKPAPFTGAAR